MGIISTWLTKGRKIKSRGIALTHKDQGYSANGRHISLLTKSDIDPESLTVDIIKSLEQVQLKISMEEFLRRFFDIWSSDAELLTKLLGFKTELEQSIEDNPPSDDWEEDWNKRHQEYLEDKLSSISIIKKAKNGEDLTLKEQFDLIETRKAFETGCIEMKVEFDDDSIPKEEENLQIEKSHTKESPSNKPESSYGAKPKFHKETTVERTEEVTKSQEFLDLKKANENLMGKLQSMETSLKAAEEIVKAAELQRKSVAIQKAAGMSFVDESQREAIANIILNPEMSTVVSVLEKAAADLLAKDEAITAAKAEVEEVKKSFADGKAIGSGGELTEAAKGSEDAQERLNKAIESHKAALLSKQD